MSTLERVAENAATWIGVAGLLLAGFVTGADIWTVAVRPLFVVAFVEGAVYVGLFTVVVATTGLLFVYDIWRSDPGERIESGPPVRAIVPAYRDADVVDESVRSLLKNDYGPLEIAVVVEPDDGRTRTRARELADRYDPVECLVNGRPGSKATAINCAVERSSADHFVVFDADERASKGFVATAMGELLDGTDVFQGRRIPRPTGAIETLAYCERIVVQTGYLVGELAGFTHCQSSATAFTREAFDAVGGYTDVLTEDIYFSHQCHRTGLSVTGNRHCTSSMEAPHTLRDLWGQRKRWRIGHVQVVHMRVREALEGDRDITDAIAVGRAVGAVITGGALLMLTAHVLFLSLIDPETVVVPFGSVLAVILGVWSRDAFEGRVGRVSWTVALAPLVYLGHGVLTVKAAFEYALTWSGEWYQVTKTGT